MKLLSNLEKALDREIEAIEEDEYLTDAEKSVQIKELYREFNEIEQAWFGQNEDENE